MRVAEAKTLPPPVAHKVGRNARCPCGSGKKYKNCCGVPRVTLDPITESAIDRIVRKLEAPQTEDDKANGLAVKFMLGFAPRVKEFYRELVRGHWDRLARRPDYKLFMDFIHALQEWIIAGSEKAPVVIVKKHWWIDPKDRERHQKELSQIVRDICLPIENYRGELASGDGLDKDDQAFAQDASWRTWHDLWRKNFDLNAERMARHSQPPPLPAPENGVVYIVGSGPSLAWCGDELLKVKRGCLVGVNEVAQYPGLAPKLDYWVGLDGRTPGKWVKGNDDAGTPINLRNTIGVLGPFLPLDVDETVFKSAHFFNMTAEYSMTQELRQRHPEMLELDAAATVTFSAVSLAARMRPLPKAVVMVGQDFAYIDGKSHFNVEDKSTMGTRENDGFGHTCKRNPNYTFCCNHVKAACYWLVQHGVRVINASQAGFLDGVWKNKEIEQRKLADVVKEYES